MRCCRGGRSWRCRYEAITGRADAAAEAKLDAVVSSFDIRTPGRQRVVRHPWWRGPGDAAKEVAAAASRAGKTPRELARAVGRRLAGRA